MPKTPAVTQIPAPPPAQQTADRPELSAEQLSQRRRPPTTILGTYDRLLPPNFRIPE